MSADKPFRFKQFSVKHHQSSMKVGTDAVVIGAWASAPSPTNILDIGTGSGIIALMMAQRYPSAHIDAIDIHEPSVKEARSNFNNSPWADRLNVYTTSLVDFESVLTYDLIVSNPPFFDSGQSSAIDHRAAARHNGSLSLETLLLKSSALICSKGHICMIYPYSHLKVLEQTVYQQKLAINSMLHFRPTTEKPIERVLVQITKFVPNEISTNEMIHYNEDGSWSKSYENLTKAFHPQL